MLLPRKHIDDFLKHKEDFSVGRERWHLLRIDGSSLSVCAELQPGIFNCKAHIELALSHNQEQAVIKGINTVDMQKSPQAM